MLTLNIAAYEISHASCKTQTGDLFVLQDKKQKTETKPREKAKTKGLKSSSWQILPWPHPVVTQESTACATPGALLSQRALWFPNPKHTDYLYVTSFPFQGYTG